MLAISFVAAAVLFQLWLLCADCRGRMELFFMLCDWRDEARMQIEEANTPYQR